MDDAPSEYEVGYGKPPKHSRFKAGQSGNPRGRPRGQPNLITDLMKELSEQIRIREGERERSVTKQRAMLKALVAKSLKGDTRAAHLLIGLIAAQVAEAAPASPDVPLTDTDQQILEDFLRRNTPPTPAASDNSAANLPENLDD